MPKVYRALFDISALRDEVGSLTADDAERFIHRIDHLEAQALQLIDRFETQHHVSAH
jgi:hypothetical protein